MIANRKFVCLAVLLTNSLSVAIEAMAVQVDRPNIVLIMSDDMGYSDLGCYGGEIHTPNLDRLAKEGLRFTQFYNTARCCPTRASLLTGLYPHQAGIGHMVDGQGPSLNVPSYSGELSSSAVTIAEVLRSAGYATYMSGKWHVTRVKKSVTSMERSNWPLQRGFERFYGTIHGAGSFFDPNTLVRDNELISPYADPDYQPEQFYYTDAISDQASRFIQEHNDQDADRPFFLYVAYTAAHWPMHAKDNDIQKYQGKYDAGYQAIRSGRVEKMNMLGLIDPRWETSPSSRNWEAVENQAWESRCMEVYAAMVDCMDQGIGRLIDSLKTNGQYENTLILFLQDNGGCAEGIGRNSKLTDPSNGTKLAQLPDDYLQPDMIPKQTRDGKPIRQGEGVMPGADDTYLGYGQAWANVSNTPFREYKHWVHEGGISTPLIAHWPEVIKPNDSNNAAGRISKAPSHLIDIMATCVDVASAEYPTSMGEREIQPMQGLSLRSLFDSSDDLPVEISDRVLFWEHEGNRAIRAGDWKLVSKYSKDWELYDVSTDRTEMHDLSARYPQRVEEMASEWARWSIRVGVLDWPLK